MKRNLHTLIIFFAVLFTMNSCSSDTTVETADSTTSLLVENYTYSELELETLDLINKHRVSVGLKALEKINHISSKSEEHDFYMIEKKAASHDGFVERANNIKKVLGAKSVGENIAYNYKSAIAAVTAWLNSPTHKENIEGDFTHFGIAIREDATTGKKYYTNIFVKI